MAFRVLNPLGTRNFTYFVALPPTAHMLARLRIHRPVAGPAARLATDWWGATFVGRVSHPLDDSLNFKGSSHHPIPSDQPCLVALRKCHGGPSPKVMSPAPAPRKTTLPAGLTSRSRERGVLPALAALEPWERVRDSCSAI